MRDLMQSDGLPIFKFAPASSRAKLGISGAESETIGLVLMPSHRITVYW